MCVGSYWLDYRTVVFLFCIGVKLDISVYVLYSLLELDASNTLNGARGGAAG
jgi:hypothetical protein